MNLVGSLHRALVMRDDDELGASLELAYQPSEGRDAELIQGRVNFVEQTERAGLSRNSENTSANADSAFSPPDSKEMSLTFFPAG